MGAVDHAAAVVVVVVAVGVVGGNVHALPAPSSELVQLLLETNGRNNEL